MTAALALLGFILLASTSGASRLASARWTQHSPRWGVLAWQTLSGSVLLAGVLVAVVLALCMLPLKINVAELSGLTPAEVARHYEPPTGDWLGLLALAAAVTAAAVVIAHAAGSLLSSFRGRRSQLSTLALVGRKHPDGFILLSHDTPVVYCIPGRARTVVVSTGAQRLLSERELSLVLGHERAHLRSRHDLALTASDAVSRAIPLPLFRTAHEQIATLIEMQADDSARAASDRRSLANALVTLSVGQSPQAAIGAGDTAALARVRRLASPGPDRLSAPRKALVALACATAIVTPVGLALAPAFEASATECCTTSQ